MELKRIFIGIDPGKTGCLVALTDVMDYIDHLQMPLIDDSRVCGMAIGHWIESLRKIGKIEGAFIEKVGARPAQGVCSMFSFGYNTGVVVGALSALGIYPPAMTPQEWKKIVGCTGEAKDYTRIKALETYPQIEDLYKKAKGQALADAIFICWAGAYLLQKLEK